MEENSGLTDHGVVGVRESVVIFFLNNDYLVQHYIF